MVPQMVEIFLIVSNQNNDGYLRLHFSLNSDTT